MRADWDDMSDLEQDVYGRTFPDCQTCDHNNRGWCEIADKYISSMQAGFCGDFRLRKEVDI